MRSQRHIKFTDPYEKAMTLPLNNWSIEETKGYCLKPLNHMEKGALLKFIVPLEKSKPLLKPLVHRKHQGYFLKPLVHIKEKANCDLKSLVHTFGLKPVVQPGNSFYDLSLIGFEAINR